MGSARESMDMRVYHTSFYTVALRSSSMWPDIMELARKREGGNMSPNVITCNVSKIAIN
jgi:hypothetical protein